MDDNLLTLFPTTSLQLIVCGEAMSHCVNYTLRDIVKYWHGDASKVVLLKDGTYNLAN